MFNKLKQFKDLRDQAKTMQDALGKESISVDDDGIVMTLDGNLQMTGLAIDESWLTPSKKEKLEKTIKQLHEKGLKKMQRIMAMKMKEMGGLPNIPGLS
ncbi:MAG: YbaB/EbfC family nucleoid-associated protein [Candidatus Magasanikbacteria bacterium]|jgi:DNA-binding protein YbaB|nr:YbaB/EbfC family nucleoid-associated protein [Candidatus Magasanikbacteria bacterium]MBT4221064.1 YbaB/EbfC family nucleoid-associated protein [Candidatus Magasanikbacteria bacterium]MBT4350592.1 YbaB/EbfC family nucleoid-associated protein [Candidatus Magasanikbacteria bacterium]MBT4542109.1 YbaB/EbfC family nucleoid-associated protein [Candidatus Magasanikbacteria bacterium]MBT6253231.1 YbaB/EbfC family nucleoid-associated protein [Candidatus Magasanikbacteria bacterium]